MRSIRSLCLPLVLPLAALLAVAATTTAWQQAQVLWSPLVPWGLTLQTDRVYYAVGDSLDARFVISNQTGQTTWGWSGVRGGNGCTYRFTIQDAAGQVVWQPGTIFGGTFSGPGCLFAETNTSYLPRSTRRQEQQIPLIYQNAGGVGTLGADLPPGNYELRVRVTFIGPKRSSGSPTEPGTDFSAGVPFRIE